MNEDRLDSEEPEPVTAPKKRLPPPVIRGNPDGPTVRLLTRAEIDEAMFG